MSDFTLYPFSSAPRVPFNFDGRVLYASGRYEMVHLTLQPGEGMAMHAQPTDVVFFVLAGTGTLAAGEESVVAEENATVHIPAGVQRAWCNTGTVPLRILVNKLLKTAEDPV